MRKFCIGPLFSYVAAMEFCNTLKITTVTIKVSCLIFWWKLLRPSFASLNGKQCQHSSSNIIVVKTLR